MRLWVASVSSRHHRGYNGERSLVGRAKGGPENGGLHRDGKWGCGSTKLDGCRSEVFKEKCLFCFNNGRELRDFWEWGDAGVKAGSQ